MTSAWKTPRILALSVFVLPTRTKAPGSVFARRPPLKVSVEISPTSEFVDSAAMYGCCAAVVAWMNEMPAPVMSALAVIRSAKYIKEGLLALWHRKLSVAVLDATAVTVSMVRGDFATAGSVMFMLRLGEILEEWTHKKSVADLASAMSLRVENVWQQVDGTEVLTKVTDVKPGDRIVIRAAAQYLHIGHRPEKHDRSVGGRKYTEEKCALSAFLFCAS